MSRNRSSNRLNVGQLISLGLILLLVNPLLSDPQALRQRVERRQQIAQSRAPIRPPSIAPQVVGSPTGQSQTLLPDGRTLLLGGAALSGFSSAASTRNTGSDAVTRL